MKGSLTKFFKKTSKVQRIAIISAVLVMIGTIASVSYISTKAAATDATGSVFTTTDGLWDYVFDTNNEGKPTIVGYNGTDTTLTFPYKTYYHYDNGTYYRSMIFEAIDTTRDYAEFFHNMDASELKTVTIPSNFTRIGNSVFYNCTSLTSVKFSDKITAIGNYTFQNCTSLKEITIPSGVTVLGHGTFRYCTALETVNFPSNLTVIKNYTFQGCTSLKTLNFPSTLTNICDYTFAECTGLTTVTLPENLTRIGNCTFQGCSSLTDITLPDTITDFGTYVFQNCTSMTEMHLPAYLTFIPTGTFSNTGIQDLVIPYGYTAIGDYAFLDCKKLVNVVIPVSVTRIGYDAFSCCTTLEKVVVPNSVTDFSSYVFSGCTSLKTATLPKGIKTIPECTFQGCTSLTEVKNIDQITEIGSWAFANCSSLTTLELPDTLTAINYSAFRYSGIDGCTLNLKNVSSIGSFAFEGTTFSGEFTIPPKVTWINSNIFYEATVPKLIIPSTVTGVDSYAFSDNAYIKELVWNSTSSISYRLMQNNTYIEKVTITTNISYIDDYAFDGCTNLKEISAKFVRTIYSYAFRNCTSLSDINDLIDEVNTISGYAFSGCSSLGSVKLGGNLSSINNNAFEKSGITYLDASNFTGSVSSNAFYSCQNLTEVYNWNGGVNSYVFQSCTALTKFTFGPRCSTLSAASYFFRYCNAIEDIYWLNPATPSSINNYFMNGTGNTETIHYYKPSGTDRWLSHYNSYGQNTNYTFQLEEMEASTEPTVTSISIDQPSPIEVYVGKTAQLTATITYSDGTTKTATADDVSWRITTNNTYASIDPNGLITGISYSGYRTCTATVYSKEANVSAFVNVKVLSASSDPDSTDEPSLELLSVRIDNNYVYEAYNKDKYQYIDKPYGVDRGNNGINASSYSDIRFLVTPYNSSADLTVEVTEGADIVSVTAPTYEYEGGYWDSTTQTSVEGSQYVSGITHIAYEDGYKYGDVTIKITYGDAEPLVYSFTIEEDSTIAKGAQFDNSKYQSEFKLEIGKSYDYTAFPLKWNGTNPYMWAEVTYTIDDTSVASLSVNTVENSVYDVNTDLYYTARVATVVPKKVGTFKLRAHSGRRVTDYEEITLTVIDPNATTSTVRPETSDDPDEVWATSVTFPQDEITILVNGTQTLTPVIEPANTTDELTYYSLDKSIATINPNTGVITGVAVGKTTVGVSTSSGINGTTIVNVVASEIKTTGITAPETVTMYEGDTVTLEVTRTPANTTDSIVLTSSDESIVKVVDGRLVAVAEGTATVTITSGDVTETVTINITKPATGISIDTHSADLVRGDSLQLTATLEPEGSTDEIKWTSSNENIATVSSTGEVTTVGYGYVTITATVQSKYSDSCLIYVSPTINLTMIGGSIRMSDPYGIRFGTQLGKDGDYSDVEIVEYGTIMLPTATLGDAELTLNTKSIVKAVANNIFSETSSEIVYTGVLINIPESFFSTEVSGRGYLIYKDDNGAEHVIYTDTISRSFNGVAQTLYDSYSQLENPTESQLSMIAKLEAILGISSTTTTTTTTAAE